MDKVPSYFMAIQPCPMVFDGLLSIHVPCTNMVKHGPILSMVKDHGCKNTMVDHGGKET